VPHPDIEARYNALLLDYHEGRLQTCADGCRTVLDDAPEHLGTLHLSGVVEARLGHPVEALECLDRALAIDDSAASLHHSRGNVLLMMERHGEALDSYDRALELGPENPFVLQSRGTALQASQRPDEALQSYARAIAIKPDMAEALANRAGLLLEIGRNREAAELFRRAREAGADADEIAFKLAAMKAGPPVRSMPPQFVRRLFDEYAPRFDEHLTGSLDYRVPELLGLALAELKPPGTTLDIVDLGCGTGLCAPVLAPHARRLDGVDISERMLERARARGLYEALECAELTGYLADRPQAYDLAVATDVLIYFGDLSGVFAAVHAALRGGGLFVFTVEGHEEDGKGFTLGPERRFRHGAAYVRERAAAQGFELLRLQPERLRNESAQPVTGYVVSLRRH
jgi:predicted TPR repeat methyltransferase